MPDGGTGNTRLMIFAGVTSSGAGAGVGGAAAATGGIATSADPDGTGSATAAAERPSAESLASTVRPPNALSRRAGAAMVPGELMGASSAMLRSRGRSLMGAPYVRGADEVAS